MTEPAAVGDRRAAVHAPLFKQKHIAKEHSRGMGDAKRCAFLFPVIFLKAASSVPSEAVLPSRARYVPLLPRDIPEEAPASPDAL